MARLGTFLHAARCLRRAARPRCPRAVRPRRDVSLTLRRASQPTRSAAGSSPPAPPHLPLVPRRRCAPPAPVALHGYAPRGLCACAHAPRVSLTCACALPPAPPQAASPFGAAPAPAFGAAPAAGFGAPAPSAFGAAVRASQPPGASRPRGYEAKSSAHPKPNALSQPQAGGFGAPAPSAFGAAKPAQSAFGMGAAGGFGAPAQQVSKPNVLALAFAVVRFASKRPISLTRSRPQTTPFGAAAPSAFGASAASPGFGCVPLSLASVSVFRPAF